MYATASCTDAAVVFYFSCVFDQNSCSNKCLKKFEISSAQPRTHLQI